MTVEILTADENIYQGEADLVTFPGKDGSFGVMNNHAPMIASLRQGKIVIKKDGQDKALDFDVNGGVVEVMNNNVVVLAE